MRRLLELLGELSLVGLGVAGLAGVTSMPVAVAVVMITVGAVLVGLHLLSLTFVKTGHIWSFTSSVPKPLRIGPSDYARALVAWLLGFRRTYAVAPGLYYTGTHYDPDAPLLVTANYHLTVFLVTRRVRSFNARLLVIDTDGINVWCAAGKGRFGNEEILRQLDRYPHELLGRGPGLRLILPKFGMSGVDLHALKERDLRPIVGPLYARDLPGYLAAPPLLNRGVDRVDFGLQSRIFVWLPGLIQVTALSALLACAFWLPTASWGAPVQPGIIGILAILATAYALLFPLIPGRRFAVKGLVLGILLSKVLMAVTWDGGGSLASMAFVVPFTVAGGILVGLEFTGNSAVSNYSRVKREMVAYLPISALLLVVSAGVYMALEVVK